jgi:hypothetical protein
LAGHRDAVTQAHELVGRKVVVDDLRFLHAQDIGLGTLDPVEDGVEPRANRVDVPGGDFH